MTITVNGETRQVDDGCTVAALLEQLGLSKQPCAVELNRSLVTKSLHDRQSLRDGDSVEIVTLVGGG